MTILQQIKAIKENTRVEQVLGYFGIPINDFGKILCPQHQETVPSAHVYPNGIYCFGCASFFDVPELIRLLLEKETGTPQFYGDVVRWLESVKLPDVKPIPHTHHDYRGAVPPNLIEYWFNCMDDEKYTRLTQQRLITKSTAVKYKLGWRPDTQAWTIPFYQGEVGQSPIDIVQFRNTKGTGPKYYGLDGHNRGSVMNAFLLEQKQPYIIILFHAYDPITTYQDGIISVGFNGCMPFKKDEKERVQKLFEKQDCIFVVPDNTPSEFKSAAMVSDWLNAEIRYFDRELPEGCDYIDYRQLGHTPKDFLQDVVGIEPITQPNPDLITNVIELLKSGDKNKFSSWYIQMQGYGQVCADVAREIAKQLPGSLQQGPLKKRLWNVRTLDELIRVIDFASELSYNVNGGW